ncbi:Uncharacterised protein [Mycobacteroides abscessus]|nr:Uncharacterised protein [Mycobacteroides abscessus]
MRVVAELGDGAEGRGDERRERLDVGAQHDDVARLERRVGREQADERLAQHLDLPGAPVAREHLHGAVRGPRDAGRARPRGPSPGPRRP